MSPDLTCPTLARLLALERALSQLFQEIIADYSFVRNMKKIIILLTINCVFLPANAQTDTTCTLP